MSNIVLKNVYKVYEGGVRAVSDFNLEIKDKEFIVFVGPSGCGKSTTLRMIAGLEEITSGDLLMNGTRVNDVEPKDRNIAMVFQSYALYPHMTVFQNMAFGLHLRKLPKDQIAERVRQAAKILGIEDLLNRKPKALSGGQRQRVALGRAIVREPSVFLLDEPLSNLDAKLRVAMRIEITKLQKRLSTTFIYVTHDQTEAMTMGDRIVVMKDGFMQQVDSPATLYEQPCNVFVATFLGSPQMNIFKANLLEKDGKLFVSFGNNQQVEFTKTKSKQLVNAKYINEEILFGIRPENISVSNKGIEATIDALEHLGSETILYLEIAGLDNNIIAKIPTNYTYKQGQKVFLSFDMDKSHGFDINTSQSIIGVPRTNSIKCSFVDDKLVIGNKKVENIANLTKHIFKCKMDEIDSIGIDVAKVSLVEEKESICLSTTIDFKILGNDNTTYYSKIDGLDEYFVFRTKDDLYKENESIDIYLPIDDLDVLDEKGFRINSKEIVSDNKCIVNVKTVGNQTTIHIGNSELKYDNLNVADGKYEFVLHEEGPVVAYSKKYAKEQKINRNWTDNTLVAKAYDEDRLNDERNCIFVQINGFENYVTAIIKNEFSVYKMPVFGLTINKEDFSLYKID